MLDYARNNYVRQRVNVRQSRKYMRLLRETKQPTSAPLSCAKGPSIRIPGYIILITAPHSPPSSIRWASPSQIGRRLLTRAFRNLIRTVADQSVDEEIVAGAEHFDR